MNGEPAFDPIALGAKPAPAQTGEFNPIALGAKPAPASDEPAFDPVALGARPDRRAKMREIEQQINATVDQPDLHEKLKADYAAEDEAYRKERGFLGRVKDWYADADIAGAANGLYTKLQELTPDRLLANAAAKEALNLVKEGKTPADVTKADILKAGVKVTGKALAAGGVGAGVGAMDAIHGTADILANVGGELASAAGRKDVAAALDAERVGLMAEKEEAVKDLTEGLGIDQGGTFEAGRIAGGIATPISLPGAGKVLRGASKLTDEAGKVIAAGAKKAAGGVLRAGAELPGVVSDAVTLGLAAKTGVPAIGLASHVPGGGVVGSAVGARMATNMLSDDSLLGLGKYFKAASDAMAEKVATATGKVPSDLVSVNVARVDNLTQAIGDWSTDIQRSITAKPKGAADILMKSKIGESIVENAEKVGADLISAQDDVISTLQRELDKPGLSTYQRSLINAKLDAAQARQASIAAGVGVVKHLKTAEQLTDVGARVLADATLGATAGTALAAATSKPSDQNALGQGIVNGAFFGTILANLGRAAIEHAPDSPSASSKNPIGSKEIAGLLENPDFASTVRSNTELAIRKPAEGLEVVDSVPEGAIAVQPAVDGANTPKALRAPAVQPAIEGANIPKALRAPAAEELPLGDTKSRAPDMTALRDRVEKTQKLIDSLYEKDNKAPLSDDDFVTLENAEAQIERDASTLKSMEELLLKPSPKIPKALRAPAPEELPLGNTKSSAPDMTALRARVEKTQKVIDELSVKDVKEGLTDNELVTLEQAEATIARDVETLKGLEASELTSSKKQKKVLAMEKTITAKKKVLAESPLEKKYEAYLATRDEWVKSRAEEIGKKYTDKEWAKAEALREFETDLVKQVETAFGVDSKQYKEAKARAAKAEKSAEALAEGPFTEKDVEQADKFSFHAITPESLNQSVKEFRSGLMKKAETLGEIPPEIMEKIDSLTDKYISDQKSYLSWRAKNPGMMAAGPAANKAASKYPKMSVTKDVLDKFEQNVNGVKLRRQAELNAPKRAEESARLEKSRTEAKESVKAATKSSVGTTSELMSALKAFSKSAGRTQQKAMSNAALKLIKEKGINPNASTESIQGLYDDIVAGKGYSNHLPNVVNQ